MIEETAVVTQCAGDFAWVEAQRQTVCGQCSANKGCGTAVLAKVLGNKTSRIKALNHLRAREGETVIIGLQESALVTGSVAVYLLPLISMIVFAVLGEVIAQQVLLSSTEWVTILFAMLGLIVAGIWARRFNHSIQHDERYQAVIMKRLAASGTVAVSNIL